MHYTVYKTTNLLNNKIYVGVHAVEDLKVDDEYMGSGIRLKRAVKKYGRENFKKIVLVSFEDLEAAYLAESMVVDEEFIARSDTYNIIPGGSGGTGKKMSEEARLKMSIAKLGKRRLPHSKETIAKMALAQQNRSEETKRKLAEAHRGMKRSENAKQNMWLAKQNISEETKRKMSESAKNKPPISEETRRKLSETSKAQWERRKSKTTICDSI